MLTGSTGRLSITNRYTDIVKPVERVGIILSVALFYDMVSRTRIEGGGYIIMLQGILWVSYWLTFCKWSNGLIPN